MLTPLVRLVSSRIRSLNRRTAFGAIRRFGSRLLVKLKPRNFRSHGRATALFCWFTWSLSFVVDRKSTRLNSSHLGISYAVFCLKKKKKQKNTNEHRTLFSADRHSAQLAPTA